MNVRILAIASALMATASFNPPVAAALESRIDAVTVYPRGAEVTRIARITLTPGSNTVVLDGFPGDIGLSRIQAMVKEDSVEVRSIRLDTQEQREAYDAEVQRLEEAITQTKDAIAAIDDEIAAAELQLKFLEGLAQGYAANERSEAATGQADIASWQQALDSIGKGASGAMQRKRDARKSRREVQKDLSVLERELENKLDRRADSVRLLVSLASPSALETNLRVTYFQRQARWHSTYAAYLDTASSELRLTHEAQVSQTTSEDWQDVELTLSTGNPGGAMQAPEQDSEFLDLRDPRSAESAAARGRAYEFRQSLALEEIVVMAASVRPNRYAVIYQASERADVANEADQEQTVPLTGYRFNVALVTRTTPRKNARAYLTARFTQDRKTPLFSGPMRVVVDGAYAGLAELPELLPGADAVLPMGPDRQVEVLVIDKGGEKGSEGFFASRNSELTDFLFDIVNRHSRATSVEVIDYYPVPRDERIEVSVPRGASAPDEKDLDERPGVLAWRKELKPGERWQIVHQYEVSYPEDTTLARPR